MNQSPQRTGLGTVTNASYDLTRIGNVLLNDKLVMEVAEYL